MEKRKLLPIVLGSAALFTLVASAALYLIVERHWSRYTLFFPVHNVKALETEGEIRRLPRYQEPEKALRTVVDELLLGPAEIQHDRIVPENTDINTFIYKNHTLYIDFAKKLIISDPKAPLPLMEKLEIIQKTINFNFKQVKKVVFTINGEIPLDEKV